MNKIKKSENTKKPKQATLFQSWGGASQQRNGEYKSSSQSSQKSSLYPLHHDNITISLLDDDDDDQELARALEESLADHKNRSKNGGDEENTTAWQSAQTSSAHGDKNEVLNISFGREEQETNYDGDRNNCLSQWKSSDQPVGELPGFDQSAGCLWIYPTNYPVREYQFNIVQKALLRNTLVTLPTGLGKTFIASVIMYNFYRWYPEGKVIFMAPTKPLVAQQIEACYNIMGIPRDDTAEMTGSMNPTERQKAWRDRRVFFLTPQVITNDLSRGTCPAQVVKCVVVDEAHKALGNHAYCQVIRELMKYTQQFRVLALSATPGSDIKSVQNVVSNLAISHIELRSEESADIKPYTHERIVDKVVVPLGDELNRIKNKYIQVLSVVVKRLVQQRVLYNREPTSLSKFLVLKAREAFRQNPPESLPRNQHGVVEGDFALAMSLYHGFELLQLHGIRSLFNFLEGIVTGNKAYGRTRTELMRNADFNEIMENLRDKFQPRAGSSSESKPVFLIGHPKMVKLEEIVLEHFRKFETEGQPTRVMIFSQYRDSVQEITTILQRHQPLVKVMSFIGQSSAGKATKGFTQKEQLKVMQAFRTGDFNTLVATCVGEEGLDIGDVDLIVCFDAHKSPIRLVQRMGRTGRKRQGHIVMLMTEGKEEQIYNHSQYTKRSIHRAILNGARSLVYYPNNPRMIPAHLTPACHRMHITVKQQQQQQSVRQKGKGQNRIARLSVKTKAQSTKCAQEEAGISLEEFAELKSCGPDITAKHLPAPRMMTLQTKEPEDQSAPSEEVNTELDVAEWLPWQNTLQQTTHFGHSRRSVHLVELLEFIDLQQMLPPEEDNYGQEMRTYLDMDDVFSDHTRPKSSDITQFVVPSPRNQDTRMGREEFRRKQERSLREKKTEGGKRPVEANKKKKKHMILPPFEIDEDSDDSDFLPDVDFSVTTASRFEKTTDEANVVGLTTESTVGNEAMDEENNVSPVYAQSGKLENVLTGVSKTCENMLTGTDETGEHVMTEDNETSEKTIHSSSDSPSHVVRHTSKPTSVASIFRIKPPPPISDIPKLLSSVTPEALNSVEVSSALRKNPFQAVFPDHRMPVFQFHNTPVSEERGSDLNGGSSNHEIDEVIEPLSIPGVSELVSLEKRKDSEMETSYNEPLEEEAVMNDFDSLSDSEFEALELKMLNKHKKTLANKHTIKARESESALGTLHSAKTMADQVENDDDVQASIKPSHPDTSAGCGQAALSQTKVKSKKPLFRPDVSDIHVSTTVHTASVTSTDMRVNNSKQKSPFVYNLSQAQSPASEKQVCSEMKQSAQHEYDPIKTAQSFIRNTILESKSDMNATDNNSAKNKTAVLDDWVTGRQLLESERERRQLSKVEHTVLQETSVSDSFLQQNFLGDDDDFDNSVAQNVQHQLSGKSAQKTLHSADEVTTKSVSLKPSVTPKGTSIRSPESLSPGKSPYCKEETSKNESMYTFTQALECVHSPSAPDFSANSSFDRISKPPRLPGEDNGKDNQQQENSLSAIPDEAKEDSPNFDLGFDFDEDIIPPSPETEPPVSLLASKTLMTKSCVFSVRSGKGDSGEDEGSKNIPNLDNCENDDIVLDVGSGEQDSPCFMSSFQSKPLPSCSQGKAPPLNTSSEGDQKPFTVRTHLETEHLPHIERRGTVNLSDVERRKSVLSVGAKSGNKESDDSSHFQHKGQSSPVGSGLHLEQPAFSSQGFTSHEQYETSRDDAHCTQTKKTVFSRAAKDVSPNYSNENMMLKKTDNPPQLRISSIGMSNSLEEEEFEGAGGFAANFALNADFEDEFESDIEFPELDAAEVLTKGPVVPAKFAGGVNCSTPVSDKRVKSLSFSSCSTYPNKTDERPNKRKHLASFSLALEDDGSDFEECVVAVKKSKGGGLLISDDSELDNTAADTRDEFKVPLKKREKSKKRKRGCAFLDDEAELSDDMDVSSDEAEDNLDMLEGSFIDNCTQMTQASQIDMQAVYMKSVRSPEPHRDARGGRYRLQYRPAHVSNVYSQLPNTEEEESQYEEDSFCVDSEEEESDYGDSDAEVSAIQMTKRYSKQKKGPAVKQVKGRQRVLQLADSCSSEEEDFERLPPSQVIPLAPRTKKSAVKALLSSSDDNLDVSATDPPLCKRTNSKETLVQRSKQPKNRTDEGARSKTSQGFEVSCSDKVNLGMWAEQEDEEFNMASSGAHFNKISLFSGKKSSPGVAAKSSSTNVGNHKEVDSSVSSLRSKPEDSLCRQNRGVCDKSKDEQGACQGGGDVEGRQEAGVSFSLVTPVNLPGSSCFTSLASGERGKMVILVDSREISGAQDIVSALRLEHNAEVCTRQLTACDYILSNRMSVDRLNWSSFSNSTNRTKLCERVQHMQSLYDRCVIIVEKDRIKPGEEKQHRPQHHSKYLDNVLAQLNQTAVRIFFTDSQGETAKLLSLLTAVECRKGMAITAPVSLSSEREQVVKFYLSIPRLTVTHALNLSNNFKTIHEFLNSSVNAVQTKGHMSFSRATEVANFVRRRFSRALTSK